MTSQDGSTEKLYTKRSFHSESQLFQVYSHDTNWKDVSDGGLHTYLVWVKNISNTDQGIYFYRSQRIPAGWTSSVCWGSNCFAASDDSESATIHPGDSLLLTLDMTAAFNDVPDSGKVWMRIGVLNSIPDTVQLSFYSAFIPHNPPLIFQWAAGSKFQYVFNGAGSHSMTNYLENHGGVATNFKFTIQDSLPEGWSRTLCIVSQSKTTCANGDTVSYVFPDFPSGTYHGEGTYRERVRIMLQSSSLVRKDSAVFHLAIKPKTTNPLDSANYRFVAIVNTHTFANDSVLSFTGGEPQEFSYPFNNLCTIRKTYSFSLLTGTLPQGWSIRYSVADSSPVGSDVRHVFDSLGFQTVKFTLQAPSVTQSDTVMFTLIARDADNPGDSSVYPMMAIAEPQNAVSVKTEDNVGIVVTNAWPNPVYGASKLNLDVLTDRDAPAAAEIYDMAGSSMATVDLGLLHRGENAVQIGALSLPSGQYIIRVEQAGASSEIVKVNYIR